MRDTLEHLLRDLGNEAGLGALELDEAGYCGLVFDRKIDVGVLLSSDERGVRLFSTVGELRDEDVTKAYRQLLLANHFWQQTGGGTLCLDDTLEPHEAGTVLLIRELPLAGLESSAFRDMVTVFVDAVEFWQARLATSPDQWVSADELNDAGVRV